MLLPPHKRRVGTTRTKQHPPPLVPLRHHLPPVLRQPRPRRTRPLQRLPLQKPLRTRHRTPPPRPNPPTRTHRPHRRNPKQHRKPHRRLHQPHQNPPKNVNPQPPLPNVRTNPRGHQLRQIGTKPKKPPQHRPNPLHRVRLVIPPLPVGLHLLRRLFPPNPRNTRPKKVPPPLCRTFRTPTTNRPQKSDGKPHPKYPCILFCYSSRNGNTINRNGLHPVLVQMCGMQRQPPPTRQKQNRNITWFYFVID